MIRQLIRQRIRQLMIVALATVTLGSSVNAKASEIPHAWVGGLFGLSVPNADNSSSRGMFGITGGAKIGDNLGVGGYSLSSQKDETFGKFNYDLFGVQVSYHFDGDATGAWFGGRIGTTKVDSGALNFSPMNIGAVAGYDYLLAQHISLGGEVSWMSISESSPLKSFSTLNFLAALKFWF
jgi:hypothetical protein